MAKGNMFLGRAKGKVGSVVFSVVEGEQVTRAKAASISNPRTFGQNVQRAVFSTVAKAASLMRPIVDHSYAGIAYDVPSLRHFRKINLDKLRNAYIAGTKVNLSFKGGLAVPNEYIVSQGNLPTIPLSTSFGLRGTYNVVAGNSLSRPSISDSSLSFAELCQMLPGLQAGDQITVLRWYLVSGSIADGTSSFTFDYDRVILADNIPPNETILHGNGFVLSYINEALSTSSKVLTSSVYKNINGDSLGVEIDVAQSAGDDLYAVAIILSRKVGGSWQRSTQSLYLTNGSRTVLSSAVDSYSKNTDSILDDNEYLNNAENSGGATGTPLSGSYLSATSYDGGERDEILSILAGSEDRMTYQLINGNSIELVAYPAPDEICRTLELEGNNADGSYVVVGNGNSRKRQMVIDFGDDGNFVGSYTVTALFGKPNDFSYERKAILKITAALPTDN